MSKSQVAELTFDEVRKMSREDVVAAIMAAEVHAPIADFKGRLGTFHRRDLDQLALSARRVCRRQGY